MECGSALTEDEKRYLEKCRQMEAECRSLWISTIGFSPRLASYCPHWHDFTPQEWAKLVAENSEFINIAPVQLFEGSEWYMILARQPELIDRYPGIIDSKLR